jgi:hypothetical protein
MTPTARKVRVVSFVPWRRDAVSQSSMADDDALRSRRKRRHAAGDHSLCGRRCEASRPTLVFPAEDAGGEVVPRVMLEGLARRLEAAHAQDPADANLARELRMTLQALGAGGAGDSELAGFAAEFGAA